jgi:phenylacetate-CoA ligase
MISQAGLDLFHRAANELPAYRAYLKAQNCDPLSIQTSEDFTRVPVTTKKLYLQTSERADLIWKDNFTAPLWYCSTSGSTGTPYYFPRTDALAARGARFAEAFLQYSSYGKGRTLVIMGFGMGVWIGGIITLRSFELAAIALQAPVAFLPTGYNKQEVFKALRNLSPDFDQTILVGYPPFVKEIIDEAENEDLDLTKLNLRLMFAAEAFTETFRSYVCEKAGMANPLLDTLNIYGSADLGAMGYETPVSILVRCLALDNPELYQEMFGQIEKTPTLAQYHPDLIEFEVVNGELLITSDEALPLIRYAIGDHGGVLQYEQVEQLLAKYQINLMSEIQKAGIGHTVQKLPFVYVYERVDLSATLQGIIIYPEFVKEGLLADGMPAHFTERFTMSTKHDIHHNQFLQINLELQKDVEISDKLQILALHTIQNTMISKSSEFAEVSKSRASDQLLQIVLWANGDPRYFAAGTKQTWVKKA